jgi:hypothetical protein
LIYNNGAPITKSRWPSPLKSIFSILCPKPVMSGKSPVKLVREGGLILFSSSNLNYVVIVTIKIFAFQWSENKLSIPLFLALNKIFNISKMMPESI